jgi:hypothetical protein
MPPGADGSAIAGASEPALIADRDFANHIAGRTGCLRLFAYVQHHQHKAKNRWQSSAKGTFDYPDCWNKFIHLAGNKGLNKIVKMSASRLIDICRWFRKD